MLTHTHAYIHGCKYMYIYIYMRTYMHIYIYAYAYYAFGAGSPVQLRAQRPSKLRRTSAWTRLLDVRAIRQDCRDRARILSAGA